MSHEQCRQLSRNANTCGIAKPEAPGENAELVGHPVFKKAARMSTRGGFRSGRLYSCCSAINGEFGVRISIGAHMTWLHLKARERLYNAAGATPVAPAAIVSSCATKN